MTSIVTGLPWTTRSAPAVKATLWGRPLAEPANTAMATIVARATGARRFAVAVGVMSRGGVPRRLFLLRSRAGEPLPLGRGISAPEDGAGRQVTAHAVGTWARRRRGGAEVEPRQRRGVAAPRGELREQVRPARDVAADEIRVFALEVSGRARAAREDAVAKAGREALDLLLDCRTHVDGRAVRDVAVRPGRVLAGRGTGVVEETLLREQDEGPLRVASFPRCAFRCD